MTPTERDDTIAEYNLIKDVPSYSILWNTKLGIEGAEFLRPNDMTQAQESLQKEENRDTAGWELVTYNERNGYISSTPISF